MVSRTALHMATFRALETTRPPAARLFADAYAQRFLSPAQRALLAFSRLAPARRLIEAYADRRAPGARTSGVARTRLIDDWVIGECEDGAQQLVILGAGYDCRALRLPQLARIGVFELDRADILAHKGARLGAAPANLRRVPIDFMRESVRDRLLAAGFDPVRRTLFLWEGVTNYLDDASVGAVLDCVAAFKAQLIFTYIHADAVRGAFNAPGLPALLRNLRRVGEPWTFGLRPGDLPDYLAAHGLCRRADLGATEYRALYRGVEKQAGPKDAPENGQEGYEFYRVALAGPL